jgi:transcriptional regulator with GAF, ATPase, and Fis domain
VNRPRIPQARAPEAHAANGWTPCEVAPVPKLRESRDLFVRDQILVALQTHPTAKAAADALGISPPTLTHYMRRLGIRLVMTRTVAA